MKRFAPTLIGYGLGCLIYYPRMARAGRGLIWIAWHALLGPFAKSVYVESASLTHTDVFFGVLLTFIMWSHVFSMRRQTVFLSLIGALLWVAAAIGHYA